MQINIAFGINDNYIQHCCCTIASILSNANSDDEYKFFIINETLTDKNKLNLESLKKIKNFEVEYFNINSSVFQNIKLPSFLDISSYFRLFCINKINIDKILYLDSDIIVRSDIAELYSTNIDNYFLAGVEDIVGKTLTKLYNLSNTTTYINSGVILFNLKLCKNLNIFEILNNLPTVFHKNIYGDQDIINYIFQNKILPLDLKWNFSYPFESTYEDLNNYHKTAQNPAIVHYITNIKPWTPGNNVYMKNEYFKYLKLTPFYKDFVIDFLLTENSILINKLDKISGNINYI